MIECGSLEYAQARLQARHGQRVDELTWRRIETLREFAPLLELARSTALRPWLLGIAADSTVHRIETTLRSHWGALVDEVVAWMPGAWRPSLAWCALLPDLAALQHLARGGEARDWMADDGALGVLCAAPAAERRAVLGVGPFAALASAWETPQAMGPAWRAEWQRRLPRPAGEAGGALEQLVRTLADHATAFAGADPSQGWPLRGALRARLSLLLRRSALEPAAAFIHVALCALDLERLRAELLRRVSFRRWQVA